MSIPQINEGVTNHNRKQSQRICELKGYAYYPEAELDVEYRRGDGSAIAWRGVGKQCRLPNGSLPLCVVVGMLEAEGIIYCESRCWRFKGCCGWNTPEGCPCKLLSHEYANAHDLTAAMDALIKVLEKKK